MLIRHAAFLFVCAAATVFADVSLPPLISDGMVLQSAMPVPIWGKADPGEKITVEFSGQRKEAATDRDGRWRVMLDALKSATSGELTVRGGNVLTVADVLVGEVWLASGQSNMEYYVHVVPDEQKVDAKPSDQLRLFKVEKEGTPEPMDEVRGKWVKSSPAPPGLFSAVGYLFGSGLQQREKTPVGIIQSTWGGTKIDTWMDAKSLSGIPEAAKRLEAGKTADDGVKSFADSKARVKVWEANQKQGKKPVSPCDLPSRLYNGMICPIAPYAIKGVLWYQGESDAYLAKDYRVLFPAMIQDWRRTWGQERLPFLFVQLPNYKLPVQQPPARSFWAEQREAQTAALALNDVGMVVAIDLGGEDIHPKNKREVANRLLNLALAQVYGCKVAHKAPAYRSMQIEKGMAKIQFTDASLGLKSRDGSPLKGFAIAGEDRKFVWAEAKIEGQNVVVWSDQVKTPVAVRYAFQENPPTNLVSDDDLPVAPFRTDSW